MIDLAILGLLDEGPLHGYEIRRRLRAQLGLLANVSFGSLYPALARLEKAGDVVIVEGAAEAPAAPSTGSLSGERAAQRSRRPLTERGRRSRKVYRLTEKGRGTFQGLLNAPAGADDSRGFGLRWSFARHLAPAARLALLERQRAQLVQRLGDAEPADQLDDYAKSVVEHAAERVNDDIAWLDGLIAAERAKATVESEGAEPPPPISPANQAG